MYSIITSSTSCRFGVSSHVIDMIGFDFLKLFVVFIIITFLWVFLFKLLFDVVILNRSNARKRCFRVGNKVTIGVFDCLFCASPVFVVASFFS